MKKVVPAVACVFLCCAMTLVLSHIGTLKSTDALAEGLAVELAEDFGNHTQNHCDKCHFQWGMSGPGDNFHTEHDDAGVTECSICHDGTPGEGNADSGACSSCHPRGNPGKCNLVKLHKGECYDCHKECVGPITTTIPYFGRHTGICMSCHLVGDLHGEGAHSNCDQCHDGTPAVGNVKAESCVTSCHPIGNPGKCNLANNHPTYCLTCHANCVESDTSTTVSPNSTTTTPPSNHIETCTVCHYTDDLHDTTSHGSCGMCHEGGTGEKGNVEPTACVACHPNSGAGKCNLVDIHGSSCYSCHFECLDVTTTVGPETTTTTAPTDHMGTCVTCHDPEDLHEGGGHSSCAVCHEGTPQSGNVEPSACIVCHPTGNAGKCNLVNLHGSSCLSCHFECEGGGDTTTSVPGSTTATKPICPQEKIYGEDSEEIVLLRFFRDTVLSTTAEGREIIRLYYQLSPVLVAAMENDEDFKEEVKEIMDQILPIVREGLE